MPVTIRPIQPGDAPQVAQLCHQLGYVRSPTDIDRWILGLPSRADIQAAFVACLEDRVVGWIEISVVHHLQSAPHTLIGGLVVEDGLRGQNIGRMLCREVEEWTWSRGLESVVVTSRSTRAGAHRFYLRDGYTPVKTSEVFAKHRPERPSTTGEAID